MKKENIASESDGLRKNQGLDGLDITMKMKNKVKGFRLRQGWNNRLMKEFQS